MSTSRPLLIILVTTLLACGHTDADDESFSVPLPPPRRAAALMQARRVKKPSTIKGAESSTYPLVVPLERTDNAQGKRFFVGNLSVGNPQQQLRVLFDTSSGYTLLPHAICQSWACKEKKTFQPSASNTSTAEVVDGKASSVRKIVYTMADIGSGDARSVHVRDTACLQGRSETQTCAELIMTIAVQMDDEPFGLMPSDGIVGLGLNLSFSPSCNFFSRLIESSPRMAPQFGMSFASTGGELHVGGYDPKVLANPLQWSDVYRPEEGFWQVEVHAVRVGNQTLDSCDRGCRAIVDTSTHRLGVQKVNFAKVRAALAPTLTLDQSCQGPELHFDLGGIDITLAPADYTDEACVTDVGALDLPEPKYTGVYTFGELVLRHYFVVFDWKSKAIGFAPLSGGARDCRVDQYWRPS